MLMVKLKQLVDPTPLGIRKICRVSFKTQGLLELNETLGSVKQNVTKIHNFRNYIILKLYYSESNRKLSTFLNMTHIFQSHNRSEKF